MGRKIWTAALLFACSVICTAEKADVNWISTWDYIFSCRKTNGAFGPKDQSYTDLAWTYPAVASLNIMNIALPDIEGCAKNGRQSPYTMPYWSMYQRTLLDFLLYPDQNHLNNEPNDVRLNYIEPTDINPVPFSYLNGNLSYCDISSLMYSVSCMTILKKEIVNKRELIRYIKQQQQADGSFGGHIIPTSHGLITLAYLGAQPAKLSKALIWLRNCQKSSGGFSWHPSEEHYSNIEDIWYTYEAIRALKACRDKPINVQKCIGWINSLQNHDGGFGDRPGWDSRLYSTYYSVHCLEMLCGDARKGIFPKTVEKKTVNYSGMKIYQACHQFPYADKKSIESLSSLGVNLVSIASQTTRQDVFHTNDLNLFATQNEYPIEITASLNFYQSLEFPGTIQPILQIVNILFSDHLGYSKLEKCRSSQVNKQNICFKDFSMEILSNASQSGCLCYPKYENGMKNAYMMYDSDEQPQAGYNAVAVTTSTGKDLVRLYPYRERSLSRIPLMIDSDTTNAIDEWRQHVNACRILYLAKTNSHEDYFKACQSGAVVCVIRNSAGASKGIVFYGNPSAVNAVKQNISEWRWWPRKDITTAKAY